VVVTVQAAESSTRRLPRTLGSGLLLAAALLPAAVQAARAPLYGVLDNANLLACEAQYWSGQHDAAQGCYRSLLSLEPAAAIRAEALWALGDLQGANAQFQQALNAEPENPLVRVRWGELFLQTYQYQDAYNLFNEALELAPDNAWAHLGAARALGQGGDGEGAALHMAAIEDATVPAGVQFRALLSLTRSLMERDDFDEAAKALAEAFALARANGLPLLEPHALQAAFQFMQLQPYQEHIDAALALNPVYGDAWAIPGYFASITRRYREAGEFYRKAVAIEPTHWEAQLELGQNYLRLNQITEAQEHVRIAYSGDAFNPRTVNLLRLLDTFIEEMVVLNFPDPPQGPFPTLSLRLDRKEAPVLQDYARDLSERSIALYAERYRFAPKAPVTVEIFPNHEDFVVRSIGMPGVGILGVTFGYLFAMDSPTAHPRGESYHWGTTLWHEMAHVFTLEATNHLVPRWFSEGISVFEEWRTGPIPGRKIPLNVFQAMAEDKFLSIAELDDGFMRPTYEDQVIVSYMQSGLVFEFIDERFGFDSIVDMLYRFRDGTGTLAALEQTLGLSIKELDAEFSSWVDGQYSALLRQLHEWQQQQRAAFAALEQEDWQGAVSAATRAIEIWPDYVEPDSPWIALGRAYSRLEDADNEFRALEQFWQKGGYAARALMALAEDYEQRADPASALRVLQDVIWADPFREDLHLQLGNLYLQQQQPQLALREFEVLLALDPMDKAAANLKLAEAWLALDDTERSMEYLMTTLDIAPQYRPAQQLLLELTRRQAANN
jgi:tetratricopeptide (TPR) repeat protein